MSYIRSVLMPGEKVVVFGRLYWIVYLRAFFFAVFGTILVITWYIYGDNLNFLPITVPLNDILPRDVPLPHILLLGSAGFFYLRSIISFLRAWFIRRNTELAVTNLRVIKKTGFISRDIDEMNIDTVEMVDVHQTKGGHLFGYGTIKVRGTGGGTIKLDWPISRPGRLREAIERSHQALVGGKAHRET